MAADLKVIHGTVVIEPGESSITIQDGVDYTLEDSENTLWFPIITNSARMGMGRTSGGGTQNLDDVGVWITVNGPDITFNRYGTANDCRVTYQIIQYTDSGGGGTNEIIVHDIGTVNFTTEFEIALDLSVYGVDVANVVPFITGQAGGDTGATGYNSALHGCFIEGEEAFFRRGDNRNESTVSFAIVEFSGSNWNVHPEYISNPVGTNNTVNLSQPVASVSETFIHAQYYLDPATDAITQGLDDLSVRLHLETTSTFRIVDQTTTNDARKYHSVWCIENSDMNVARYNGTMVGSGVEEVDDISISAVVQADNIIMGHRNDSTGSGTAFPRGFICYELINTSTVRLRQSDAGQTSQYYFEVVTLPFSGATSTATIKLIS